MRRDYSTQPKPRSFHVQLEYCLIRCFPADDSERQALLGEDLKPAIGHHLSPVLANVDFQGEMSLPLRLLRAPLPHSTGVPPNPGRSAVTGPGHRHAPLVGSRCRCALLCGPCPCQGRSCMKVGRCPTTRGITLRCRLADTAGPAGQSATSNFYLEPRNVP